jgi:hypothetical protein
MGFAVNEYFDRDAVLPKSHSLGALANRRRRQPFYAGLEAKEATALRVGRRMAEGYSPRTYSY